MSDSPGQIFGKGALSGHVGVGKLLKGEPGITPRCLFKEIEGGYRFTVMVGNDITSINILNGATGPIGPVGPVGPTPVKGVDYFTQADKEEMVAAVLAELPVAEGLNF